MSKYGLIEKIIMVVVLLLIVGISTVAVIQTIGKSKWQKNSGDWKTNYYACYNAPAKTVTTIDSVPVPYPVYIKPKPTYHEPAKPDTGSEVAKACTSRYAVPIKFTQDGLTWRFLATYDIKDCFVETMEISEAVLPKVISIQTKSRDTCLENYNQKPKEKAFKFGLLGGFNINSFKRIPGVDLNVFLLYKSRWGFYTGAIYINPNQAIIDAMGPDASVWDNMHWRIGGMILF